MIMNKVYEAKITTHQMPYIHNMYQNIHRVFCNNFKESFIEKIRLRQKCQKSPIIESILNYQIQISSFPKIEELKCSLLLQQSPQYQPLQNISVENKQKQSQKSLRKEMEKQISSIRQASHPPPSSQSHPHPQQNLICEDQMISNNSKRIVNQFLESFQQLPSCNNCDKLKRKNEESYERVQQLLTANQRLHKQLQQCKKAATQQSMNQNIIILDLKRQIEGLKFQLSKDLYFAIPNHKRQKEKIQMSEILEKTPFSQQKYSQKQGNKYAYNSDDESLPNSSDCDSQELQFEYESSNEGDKK